MGYSTVYTSCYMSLEVKMPDAFPINFTGEVYFADIETASMASVYSELYFSPY